MIELRVCGLGLLVPIAVALGDEKSTDRAQVTYTGIDATYAQALAKTISAAWKVYSTEFGFKMPEKVILSVTCGPEEETRLFTDGADRVFLSLPSQKELAKPATSGVFNLYGICHELGHIAMYRTIKERPWMTVSAAEGWASYAGAVVLDRVYAAEGEGLWPDRYDYRADGTARLTRQLAAPKPSGVTQAAGLWQTLETIIGRKGFARLFAAWDAVKVDPASPAPALQEALLKLQPDKQGPLSEWWTAAAPLMIEKRAMSAIKAVVIPASRLSGEPKLLQGDDDASEGKRSIAGGGHARQFKSPGGEWYIRAVWVYGGRYGYPKPPPNQFDVALCDEGMKTIALWKKPYATFERGEPKWVRMEVPPTRVPATFNVCLDFKPTATMGVYVAWDGSTKGHSQIATPGKPGEPLKEGDWMIRVELDQPKEANALKGE